MKKIIKIMSGILIISALTGCGSDPTPTTANEKIVTFNKEELNITVDDLYKELKTRYATNYLIQTMDEKILDLEYQDDENVDAYVENQLKIYRMYYGNSDEELLKNIQNFGYTNIDEFKEMIAANYKKTLATKDYLKEKISDNDIEKYYKDNIYGDVTVSHILVKIDSTGDMTDEEKKEAEDKAQSKIKEIYEKLNAGTSFAEVAKEYSEDSATASNGGLIGTFNKGEMTKRFNAEFEEAVLNLAKEKYTTKTIQSSYGYHIIYKNNEKAKPELATVKQTIIDALVEKEMNDDDKSQYKAMIDLREKYGLTFNDEEISSQYETAVNNWLYSNEK